MRLASVTQPKTFRENIMEQTFVEYWTRIHDIELYDEDHGEKPVDAPMYCAESWEAIMLLVDGGAL